MARRTKDQAEKTRSAILDAAEREFYGHGVARTSLEEIAHAAGVTRGAVYWHFKDKIELCEAMMQRVFLPQEDILKRLAARQGSTPLADLQKACGDALRLIVRDRHRWHVLAILTHRCEYVEDMAVIMARRRQCKEHMLSQSRTLFERAKKLRQLAAGWSPRTAALGLQAMMSGLIVGAMEGRKNFRLDKEGVACIDAFFRSLRC
ncbi:MAG TPA: TetR family transcriptional regulator [Alphaproteobacteria bacterium]|nr:TetR family transcriptional regulator [Alphaproteobacteria bacterium]